MFTASGIKDKFFLPHFNQFSDAIAKHKAQNRILGKRANEGLSDMIQQMLGNQDVTTLFSPIFRLKGIYFYPFTRLNRN